MKKGKILSIMLVFLMMISFLPTNIYAADVEQDTDGHINIKLKKNLKGQLKLNIQGAYYVFDEMKKHLMVIVNYQKH